MTILNLPPSLKRNDCLLVLGAAVAYAALLCCIIPGRPIAMNDDFGYLRSVVETIQHRRPWTDDFLEPWSYSLVGLSAFLYAITGSISFATIGLQVVACAVSFWFACRIALDQGHRIGSALGLAATLLTFPTLLWKQVEYTAAVIYTPCLLAALWSAGRGKWISFFVAWAIAVASRQSALAWLLVPAAAGLQDAIRAKKIAKAKSPMIVVMVAVAWFLFVDRFANQTHAQRFITEHIFTGASFSFIWPNLKTGVWIALVALGAHALFLTRTIPFFGRSSPPGPRLLGAGVALGLLVSLPSVANGVPLSFEHPFFENSWAEAYLKCLVTIAALGWLCTCMRLSWPLTCAAAGAVLLVSLRSQLWDYYFIDAAIMAFFAVKREGVAGDPLEAKVGWRRLMSIAPAVVLLTLFTLQLRATDRLKRAVDERAGMGSLLENALRAGLIKPTHLSFAPFGLVAWHLLPYYLTHEGRDSADLGGFGIYVDHDATDIPIEGVSRKEALARSTERDVRYPDRPYFEVHPRGWFSYARFTLLRTDEKRRPAEKQLNWTEYRHEPFPLNDREWNDLISSKSVALPNRLAK